MLSDGDTNVGESSPEAISEFIGQQAQKGVFLTTMGFGMGNYRDDMMEQLANKGNGSYYYVDSFTEAKRVFQAEVTGTLAVIAKDLKIQVAFDAAKVLEYRQIGYENRDLADKNFINDFVDAGELGSGHSVTGIYELKLVGGASGDLFSVNLRHKNPAAADAIVENTRGFSVSEIMVSMENASPSLRLASAAACIIRALVPEQHLFSYRAL